MRQIAIICLLSLSACPASRQAKPENAQAVAQAEGAASTKSKLPLKEWRLKNGLRVIFVPHHRVPAVTVQVWYHAGSKDERPGIRGVAHMFEHMMFKGSKRVKPEKHAQLLSAVGGRINAFTTADLTAYHNTLPAAYFEFAMDLEAERMRSLLITPKMIQSEREVVKEEKRLRLENSPIGRSLEAIHALAFNKHPYSWTPAGDIPDLNRVEPKDCQAFYDTYYVPNNATLIVVGDLTEARMRQATDKFFGSIAKGKTPPRVTLREPPQTSQRIKNADWPSQLTVVLGTYHIPPARHKDMAALRVLSTILSAGRSSRLHQALVRKGKLALAAGGFARAQEHPGLYFLYGIGLPTHKIEAMKDELLAQVKKVSLGGVTADELKKAKNQLATSHLASLKTLSGLANQIGSSTIVNGDPLAFLQNADKLDRVSAADIKRVASTYLKPDNLSLVLLRGGPKGGK
jgi:zinc protease